LLFAIWRASERLSVLPPDIAPKWEDNSMINQAYILAYNQVRSYEETKNG